MYWLFTQLPAVILRPSSMGFRRKRRLWARCQSSWRNWRSRTNWRKDQISRGFHMQTLQSVTDEARDLMFGKSKSPESLPPTSDALKLHIERAHFQASVWKQANCCQASFAFSYNYGLELGWWSFNTTSYDTWSDPTSMSWNDIVSVLHWLYNVTM